MTFREVQVQVQEVLDVQWGDTKTTKSSYVEDGYLAYSATGPDGFLAKYDYDCDGIVLSAIGANCGSTFFATNKWSCIKNTIRILPRSTQIDLKYFYFMTKSPNFWPVRGSAQPFISQTDIREMVIKIPDLATQKKIGEIIYALELQIEKNSEIAKTLEEIAQTIFKSWFVDFDPVKAKIAGEKPVGMEDAAASMFPDSMVDSEIGPIPAGWRMSQIGDEVDCVGGGTPSTSNSEFWNGDIFWTTPKDLSKQVGLVTTSSERQITSKGLQKISSGVLPVHSVLMSSRAPIGYLSINAVPTAVNQGFIALRHSHRFAPLYLILWLQRNMSEVKNRAGGGTFAEVSRTAFKSIPFIVPNDEILKLFAEVSEPILLQLTALTLQNQELITLRDALLPRLISGELQIPEVKLVS